MPRTAPLLFDYGVAALARPGSEVSGDQHMVERLGHGVLVAVLDGLGHGRDAQIAAQAAIATLRAQPDHTIAKLVERCHKALNRTRGAVMSLASLDARDNTMTWLGVGNVEAVLVRAGDSGAPKRESILMRSGIVGHRLPLLRTQTLRIHPGDLLVFATDGIREGFTEALRPETPPQEVADWILARYGRKSDDALVLAGRWNGKPEARPA
jgi:negative regulator of sigma-B (phosphoserine phosphatase)